MSNIKIKKIEEEPVVTFGGKLVLLPIDLQKKVDYYWDRLLKSKGDYFNGKVFMIEEVKKEGENVKIITRQTDYAHFLYSRNVDRDLGEFNVRVITSGNLVLLRDDKIVLGYMGEHTAEAGTYQMPGGTLDISDLEGSLFNMKKSAERELYEEIGVDISDNSRVDYQEVMLLKSGGNQDIKIVYKVKLKDSEEEFLSNYKKFAQSLKKQGMRTEFSKVVTLPINEKNIKEFIKDNKYIIPEYLPGVLSQIIKDMHN